jgi:uncharacterized protein YjbJ (UPF0337 family)
MNKDTIKGEWKLIKGKIKEKWGRLTEDDLTEINGKREQLLGAIQKKYGLAKDKAEQELAEWEKHSDQGSHSKDRQKAELAANKDTKHAHKH